MGNRILRYTLILLATILPWIFQLYKLNLITWPLVWSSILTASISPIVTFISLTLAELRIYATEISNTRRLDKIRENLPRAINHLFKNSELNTNEDITKIRANIMRPGYALRKFRFKKALKVILTYNSEAWRATGEHKLIWESGKGACGIALFRTDEFSDPFRWNPIVFDKSSVMGDDLRNQWNLPEEFIKKTDHIKWVVSIPIVLSNRGTGGKHSVFVGILNIDGVTSLKNMAILVDPLFHAVAKTWGENFAEFFDDESLIKWMRRPSLFIK